MACERRLWEEREARLSPGRRIEVMELVSPDYLGAGESLPRRGRRGQDERSCMYNGKLERAEMVFIQPCAHPRRRPRRHPLLPNKTTAPAPCFQWAQVRECHRPPMPPVQQTCAPKPAPGFREIRQLCYTTRLRGL